jgi:hypothetical protein
MTEEEFRRKYPGSTDEQVRLYCEAVLADALTAKPAPEPDIPMPIITVSEPPLTVSQPSRAPLTTYTAPRGSRYVMRNFSLNDAPPEVPPEVQPVAIRDDLREILLGTYGLKTGLTPEQRQRLQTTDMSEADMLAMLVGAPNAQEFAALN